MNGQGTDRAHLKMFNSTASGYVSVSAYNTCGYAQLYDSPIQVINCSGGGGGRDLTVTIYPNPVMDELTVSYASDSTQSVEILDKSIKIELVNELYEKVYSTETRNATTKIPVSKLKTGIYHLQIIHNEGVLRRQILIEH